MSKHPILGSILQQLHDDHRFSPDPVCALAEFKVRKAKKITSRELSRQTPGCIGAKLFIASAALRAFRNRHLGTLMRCCEAWKPIEDCFDPISFECVDFQRLSQIIANLTRENLAEREAEITNLPWTQTEKYTALARCRGGQRAWRNKKPVLSLSAVIDEEGHPLGNEDESGRRLCEYWGTIFQAREGGPRHHQHEDILRYVQQAPDDIRWTIDQEEFDDLLALKKHSAPGLDGIPCGAYRCAGGLGSRYVNVVPCGLRGVLLGAHPWTVTRKLWVTDLVGTRAPANHHRSDEILVHQVIGEVHIVFALECRSELHTVMLRPCPQGNVGRGFVLWRNLGLLNSSFLVFEAVSLEYAEEVLPVNQPPI